MVLREATLAVGMLSQIKLHGGRGVPSRFFTTLSPGSYPDQSNQPEANPIKVETEPSLSQ